MIAYILSEKKGNMVQITILTLELLLSTGLVSTFFMLKATLFLDIAEILNSLKGFLSSPFYIGTFINFVVILILSFSKFHHHPGLDFLHIFQTEPAAPHHLIKEDMMLAKRTNSAIAMDAVMSFFSRYNNSDPIFEDSIDQDDHVTETPSLKDIEVDCVHIPSPPEAIQELEDDSLEATWKAISEGGNKKKKNKLKKSEAWPMEQEAKMVSAQSIGSKGLLPSAAAVWKDLRKSVTFNDALSVNRRGGLRGDFSVSAEESNKKFDDFIKKINRDRMLQRQESDQRALMNKLVN